jgi:CDP-2,3-bis-(O-geranylgeranyl)-sn-glycerol synthase
MATILDLLLFLVPVYVANSSPVVLGGGIPLDLGMVFSDGRRIFGDGKTLRGLIAGTLAGTVAGGIVAVYYQLPFFESPGAQFSASFVLAFGTLLGDAFGSFIKRRFGVSAGRPFILDTIMFLIVALALVFPFARTELYDVLNLIFFTVLTLILHPLTNMMANRAGLKNVPW